MTREGPRGEVRVARGSLPTTIEVALPESPTTGYLWELHEPPAQVAERGRRFVDEEDEQMAGAGGARVFDVEVTGPGRHLLVFRLRRPWEEEALETRVVEVVVED